MRNLGMSIKDDLGLNDSEAGEPLATPATSESGEPARLPGEGSKTTLAEEAAYWRAKHASQAYAQASGRPYEAYAPGYRAGYAGYRHGTTFSEREAELRAAYEAEHPAEVAGTMQHAMSTHPLRWWEVRPAAAAAFERMAQLRQLP